MMGGIYVGKGAFGILEINSYLEFLELLVPFNHFWVNASVDSYNSHHISQIDIVVVHELKAPEGCQNVFGERMIAQLTKGFNTCKRSKQKNKEIVI